MLPDHVPVLAHAEVRLRPWRDSDVELIASMASDPLISLITTVPSVASPVNVAAYLERQRRRLEEGAGYSFAITEAASDEAVGNIGLWTSMLESGRATTGYWVATRFRRRQCHPGDRAARPLRRAVERRLVARGRGRRLHA